MSWNFWSRGGEPTRPTSRLRLEPLEDRLVPAAAPPGSLLSIQGRFDPAAKTSVVFKDADGYKVQVTAASVTGGKVLVGVPVHFDAQTGEIEPGTVRVQVVQRGASGVRVSTAFRQFQITDLPAVEVAAGTLYDEFLTQMGGVLGAALQNYQTIGAAGGGAVNVGPLVNQFETLQADLAGVRAMLQPVISGSADEVELGQLGGVDVSVTADSLALADRLIASAYLGGTTAGAAVLSSDPLTDLRDKFAAVLGSDAAGFIKSNARLLNGGGVALAAGGLALGVAGTISLPAALGAELAGIAISAVGLHSGAVASTLQGLANVLRSDTATKRDFRAVDTQLGKLKGYGQADRLVDGLAGLGATIDTTRDTRSQGRSTADAIERRFAELRQALDGGSTNNLQGTWSGTMTYTVPSVGTQTASISITFNPGSGASFSGPVTISSPFGSDTGSHASTGSGDPVSQVSGQIFDSSGAPNFSYQGQLGGDTITGTMTDAVGVWTDITFTLTRA